MSSSFDAARQQILAQQAAAAAAATSTPAASTPTTTTTTTSTPNPSLPPPPVPTPLWRRFQQGAVEAYRRVRPAPSASTPSAAGTTTTTPAATPSDVLLKAPKTANGVVVAVLIFLGLGAVGWFVASWPLTLAVQIANQPKSYALPGGWHYAQTILGIVAVIGGLLLLFFKSQRSFGLKLLVPGAIFGIFPFLPGLSELPFIGWLVWLAALGVLAWIAWWRGTKTSAKTLTRKSEHDDPPPPTAYKPKREVSRGWMTGFLVLALMLAAMGPGWSWFSSGDSVAAAEKPKPVQVKPETLCGATNAGNADACAAFLKSDGDAALRNYLVASQTCQGMRTFAATDNGLQAVYDKCQQALWHPADPATNDAGGEKTLLQAQLGTICDRLAAMSFACDPTWQNFRQQAPDRP